jgi:hypothetical protein
MADPSYAPVFRDEEQVETHGSHAQQLLTVHPLRDPFHLDAVVCADAYETPAADDKRSPGDTAVAWASVRECSSTPVTGNRYAVVWESNVSAPRPGQGEETRAGDPYVGAWLNPRGLPAILARSARRSRSQAAPATGR